MPVGEGGAFFLPSPGTPGSIPSIPKKNFRRKIVFVAEVNQWSLLEESGLKMLIEPI